jgi:molybdopterin molybdotransferase
MSPSVTAGTTGGRVGVAEASARILAAAGALPPERVGLAETVGRVLATPITSPVTLPAWDNSAMDGYAVRAADVVGATRDAPVRLPVAETVPAGGFPTRPIARGTAVRIMTGAPVPDGADTVVRVEDTDAGVDVVTVYADRDLHRNVRPRGEDVRAGDVVLDAGTVLGPAQLGVLAACGAAVVSVHRRPRVALLGSGDELVELDRWADAHAGRRIVSTNGYALAAAVRMAGGEPVDLGVAPDDPDALVERLRWAARADLVVTSAGNSVGAFDHTPAAFAALGATLEFSRVRMRPGAPLSFGRLGDVPWVGLPGNPVSALVTFELFVRPLVRRMLGHRRPFRAAVTVVLDEPTRADPSLTHFQRVRLTRGDDGSLRARLTGAQGSNLLTSMAAADALLVIPEGAAPEIAAGTRLRAIPLGDAHAAAGALDA